MRRLAAAGFVLLSTLGCGRKPAAVVCSVTYGGDTQRLEFPATLQPYRVKAVDVASRFRFKAIYIREPWQAATVSLYAYHQGAAGDVLLQEGKYSPPFAASSRYGFTGRQLVYSPDHRELEYWCEVAP